MKWTLYSFKLMSKVERNFEIVHKFVMFIIHIFKGHTFLARFVMPESRPALKISLSGLSGGGGGGGGETPALSPSPISFISFCFVRVN